MPDRFHYGRITDAVHGTFGISELESDIISTPVFQRLHNVRQLGLAHLVYPGAEYSRFAHSLGACHVAGRMLRGINQNCQKQLDDDEIQMYRLTGLLHDLGHYPFSHAMEYVGWTTTRVAHF
jgi:HD superfamily phosphohydrolase